MIWQRFNVRVGVSELIKALSVGTHSSRPSLDNEARIAIVPVVVKSIKEAVHPSPPPCFVDSLRTEKIVSIIRSQADMIKCLSIFPPSAAARISRDIEEGKDKSFKVSLLLLLLLIFLLPYNKIPNYVYGVKPDKLSLGATCLRSSSPLHILLSYILFLVPQFRSFMSSLLTDCKSGLTVW